MSRREESAPPLPPKSSKRKRGAAAAAAEPPARKHIALDSEEDEPQQQQQQPHEAKPPQRVDSPSPQEEEDEEMEDPLIGAELSDGDPVSFGAQKAMGFVTAICDSLDLRWQGCSVQPLDAIWTKIGGTFMRKKHPDFRLTFSNFDSFHCQIGRFVAAMVYHLAGLEPRFVPGGSHIWRHGWKGCVTPKCLHGSPMVVKPRTVELNPASEAGKRAIAEQGGNIERNRFGRQVVVLRFDNNTVCHKDKEHTGFLYPHATGSCAMSFSDGAKALSAMKHDIAWTLALYPKADRSRTEQCVLMSTNCNCNYAVESAVSGRQTCRMTPYKLSGIDDISTEMAEKRPDMKAHLKYPHTMVYTCCNPAAPGGTGSTAAGGGRGGPKRNPEKSCSWRISYMDLRYAYVYATEIVNTLLGMEAVSHVPEFRWSDKYAFKTEVIAPVNPLNNTDPFA